MTNFIFIKIVITLDFSCGDPISKNISTNPLNNHFINFFHIRIMAVSYTHLTLPTKA